MIWRRWYTTFSRDPLTYETLKQRCTNFHAQKTHKQAELQDYIKANRKLQAINRGLDPQLKYGNLGLDLGLSLNVSSSQLEEELWLFMRKYWAQCMASDSVVKTYIGTASGTNISHSFHLVKANFDYNIKAHKRLNIGPVTALIHILLRNNDFHGCFKLVDDTVNSVQFLGFRKMQNLHGIGLTFALSTGFAMVGSAFSVFFQGYGIDDYASFFNQVLLLWPTGPFSIASGIGLFTGLKWLKTSNLPRVSWRPHTSILHRLLHSEEALLVNKVVTYFEEYTEINMKNFHISEVRHRNKLSVFDSNDYKLYSPESFNRNEKDEITDALTRYFRSELYQRKMVWNPLKEEKMFVDFWINHGDSYEWVEPDQDPAEMAILKPQKALSPDVKID